MPTTTGVHRSPRRRTAAATRRRMVARYRRSDLTQREFCLQAGLPLSTLQWWLTKARRESPTPAPVTFTEVSLPNAVRPDRDEGLAWALEIITREGVTIRWRDAVSLSDLVTVLRGARC